MTSREGRTLRSLEVDDREVDFSSANQQRSRADQTNMEVQCTNRETMNVYTAGDLWRIRLLRQKCALTARMLSWSGRCDLEWVFVVLCFIFVQFISSSPINDSWMFLRIDVLGVFSERELAFTFAICYRPSVCLSSVCRLSSITFVRPTQAVQIFGNISTALGTLAIYWHSLKISRRSSQGNPSAGEVKHKRGNQV